MSVLGGAFERSQRLSKSAKPAFKLPFEELCAGAVVSRVRIAGLMFQSLVEVDQSLVDLPCLLKRQAKAGQGFGIMRLERNASL